MNFNYILYAISKFYSRIILRKLSEESLNNYRKIEKNLKNCYKLNADIKFLNFIDNEINKNYIE